MIIFCFDMVKVKAMIKVEILLIALLNATNKDQEMGLVFEDIVIPNSH